MNEHGIVAMIKYFLFELFTNYIKKFFSSNFTLNKIGYIDKPLFLKFTRKYSILPAFAGQ